MSQILYPHKYGLNLTAQLQDHELELLCFKIDHPSDKGGLGKYRHFMNASRLILPEIKFHEWSRTQVHSLTQTDHAIRVGNVIQRFVYWPGAKSCGKTFTAAHYAFLWWLADPDNSAVMLTSTSGVMVKRRIWPVIQDLFYMAKRALGEKFGIDASKVNCGNLLDSQTILQREKGDFKRAISALSVEQGELGKAVAKLQGQHAKRIMLVVDEATDTPEAIFRTIPNMEGGCDDLTVLLIGNPISRTLDPFDRACQPEEGWDSIGSDDTEWKAKGDRELCLKPGLTVNFQGQHSPNVKAGKTIFPFLYSWENFQMEKGKEDTIEYWKWTKGRPPPEGVCNTVMSETMFAKYGGGTLSFVSQAVPISGLDPGFEGDKCINQFGLLGDLDAGKMGIQLTDCVHILPLATSKDPIDHQISQASIAECRARKVAPENHGGDATGTGRGVHSHQRVDWGEVIRVEFGGAPTDRPASADDPRPCNEVYGNRVTELWFNCKSLLLSGQLKGIPQAAKNQFCFRQYTIKSRKIIIETKPEFKRKFGSSPDEADAVSVLVEVALQRGISPGTILADSGDWDKAAAEVNSHYENAEYAPEEQVEEYEEETIGY